MTTTQGTNSSIEAMRKQFEEAYWNNFHSKGIITREEIFARYVDSYRNGEYNSDGVNYQWMLWQQYPPNNE